LLLPQADSSYFDGEFIRDAKFICDDFFGAPYNESGLFCLENIFEKY
jgi:hypothetical protein